MISRIYFTGLMAFALVISSFTTSEAQEFKPTNPPEQPKNLIKIAPLAWIHGQVPFAVESRIGYERVIGPKSSLGGSYSYLGSNPAFGFIGSVAISAALTSAIALYGKPGKVGIAWSETKIQTSGYRYQFQYKHFLGEKASAPEGFYLSPHYSYAQANYEVSMSNLDLDFRLKTENRNFNLLAGYQAVLGKHFVMEVFTGLGYKVKSTTILDQNGTYLGKMPKGTPIKLSSGFNIGWAF